MNTNFDSDLLKLINVLPQHVADWILTRDDASKIVEIILDYGCNPEVRYLNAFEIMPEYKVTGDDLDDIIAHRDLSTFFRNNRCGISGTLHRISCIRDREGVILGLTMRVGRTVSGGIELIKDLIDSGESVLLLGRPGVGKTSKLREACRYLANDRNQHVVIVDTSNEIAGDGSIPHAGVGRSRRLQVPFNKDQHSVMIEAVENHMPHVVVIDEISKTEEAEAARSVAERGIQLLATAHGETLDNLIKNKPLTMLIGQVNSVTLTDAEALRRGTQKTVLEREFTPTFTKLVELIDYDTVAIHHDVEHAVNRKLEGYEVLPEIRQLRGGKIVIIQEASEYMPYSTSSTSYDSPNIAPLRAIKRKMAPARQKRAKR